MFFIQALSHIIIYNIFQIGLKNADHSSPCPSDMDLISFV